MTEIVPFEAVDKTGFLAEYINKNPHLQPYLSKKLKV